MQLKCAIQGNLSEFMEKEYSDAANAVTNGIAEATNGLKATMRGQVKSAGMSSRLANTWRGDVYPKGKKSIFAAGVVRNSASKIMAGFEYQTVICGKDGFWLAIPSGAIPKRGLGKKMTPAIYEKMKRVKLRFVYRARGASLLVHEQKKKTVIAFFLVPQVKMPKLIHFESESARWHDRLPELILKNWSDT
ncbi:MAG: DUF6441 family protein [Lactobacillales bacterium]|nr:DUF6441 family protein [Lactobacillales bacterium]